MAANKRTDDQIARDAVLITDLFVRNVPIREIAVKVNDRARNEGYNYSLTFQQIAYDIKKILEQWKEDRNEQIDHMVEIELAKLDKIESECWIAWESSKVGKVKTKVDGGMILPDGRQSQGSVLERVIETSVGDVRFLDRIQGCIDKRIELLGLSKPKKVQLSNDPENPLTNDDEIIEELKRLDAVISKAMKDGSAG